MALEPNVIQSFLVSWIHLRSNVEVRMSDDFFEDLGLDSLDFAELISEVESLMGVEVDFSKVTDWNELRTIGNLVNFFVINSPS